MYKTIIWIGLGLIFGTSLHAQEQAHAQLVKEMQAGGVIVYIRHAQTQSDYADQITADPENCATQRVLSENGWHQARQIGNSFKALNIPVTSVKSSQFCRAWQTADLAFGTYEKDGALNFEKAETYTDQQFSAMRERVLPMLTQAVPSGEAYVIVGHDDPFEATTGIYPEPQGVSYVIKPDGNGDFTILGSIAPDVWSKIPAK